MKITQADVNCARKGCGNEGVFIFARVHRIALWYCEKHMKEWEDGKFNFLEDVARIKKELENDGPKA